MAETLIRGGVIVAIGTGLATPVEMLMAAGCLVATDLVNTRRHPCRTLTREVPAG